MPRRVSNDDSYEIERNMKHFSNEFFNACAGIYQVFIIYTPGQIAFEYIIAERSLQVWNSSTLSNFYNLCWLSEPRGPCREGGGDYAMARTVADQSTLSLTSGADYAQTKD